MASRLVHRGPDQEGFYLGEGTGLGIRRLSIVDLKGGSQPLQDEQGRYHLVYNGEIYNHRELRRELKERGHRFASRCDGEVIVHLYEEEGPRCLERLNGMFALALWDRKARRLLLARDRIGIKPLHYWEAPGRLVFASELKALLAHPEVPRVLDRAALDRYLSFEYVPAPDTIFAGVHKLPPAHYLVWEEGRSRRHRYWSVEYLPDPSRSRRDWEEALLEELRASVRRRLMSDVPLGAFLSGGLDSSTVVALMAEEAAGPVKTFCIGFDEASFDESGHARRVAQHLGTRHHEQILSPQQVLQLIPSVWEFLDEPLGDASIIPTLLLARFAREHVKVSLSGDGGDELLAGYPTYAAAHLAEALRRAPAPVRTALRAAAARLPVSTANWSFDFRLKRFAERLLYPPEERNLLWVGSFSPEEKGRIYGPELRGISPASTFAPLERLERKGHLTNRLLYLDLHFYLADDLLVKLDRASMAASLEARVPFLDHRLVELLARVPPELKLQGLRTKALLRSAMRGRLPAGILRRPKKGFGIPVARWLKGPLRPWIEDLLSQEEMARDGLFEPAGVQALLQEHLAGKRDHRKLLWTLASFVMWRRRWLGCPSIG